ncbi:hypothetical protein CB0940_00551 [Cercospora beticola]|uniref:Uncharacterized protein n=1 Tax=Cercospora beticola TaxID=122368 RepID=A0A2G5I729_CERBT|nr:hypothetical protein CB0940_00551 [Cercospora beticola]PIB00611.1 hypothetical protein CB0940_00551 [Cercospora beticola]WPA95970.1 hypothetical protein RHO25_000575 [Cercospora beticola]CAK1355758.1 unnamed protein product [Cercospora beticola]
MAATTTKGAAKGRRSTRLSDSSSNDTIDVKPRSSAGKLSQAAVQPMQPQAEPDSSESNGDIGKTLSRDKGKSKAPVGEDDAMPDAPPPELDVGDEDDEVEEYDFSNEPQYVEDTDDEDLDDDARSVITLSSEPSTPNEPECPIEPRPWAHFSEKQREVWELMYSNVTPFAMSGSWAVTEEYQREKDMEMLRYLEDHPLDDWVITKSLAHSAHNQLLERMRWRNFGIPIYGRDRVPVWSPDGSRPPPPQAGMPPSRGARPTPPGPVPSQHIPGPLYGQLVPHLQHPGPHMHPPMPPQMQPPQQRMGPAPHPNRGQLPPGVLPSQPYAHPMPPQHGQPGPHAVGPAQNMPYSIPLGTYVGHPVPSTYTGPPMRVIPSGPHIPKPPRKPREKKETPMAGTPPPAAPVPPYPARTKPEEAQRPMKRAPRGSNKAGKRPQRRQAEAEEFPWTRQIDFPEAKKNATWDDTIYDRATLDDMEDTRRHNIHLIEGVDSRLQEMQRQARNAKNAKNAKKAATADGETTKADTEAISETEAKPKERKKRGSAKTDNGDPYHSGCFSWSDEASETLGKQLGYEVPDDAIDAGMDDKVSNEQMVKLKIYWNPGKKGGPADLEQARFSVRDSVLTRKQLSKTLILNRRAAECIVDFCPDLLWRGILLRVCSEGGYGNKDVRDRFCYNGCYCDKATITKRISAALGQKQVSPNSRRYNQAELEWYDANVKDFTCYIEYFGRRTGHRNMLKIQMQSEKRRAALEWQVKVDGGPSTVDEAPSTVEEEGKAGPSKRRKLDAEGSHAASKVEDTEEGEEYGESERSDAVSVQDSDILDEMDETE